VESTETKNETIEEPETEKNPEIKPETASIKEPEAVTTKEETQPQEKIEEKKNPYAVSISDD